MDRDDISKALSILAKTPASVLRAYGESRDYKAVSRVFVHPQPQIGKAESLFRRIRDLLPQIKPYFEREPAHAVGEPPPKSQDPRFFDIDAVYQPTSSQETKFRAYLALRSLGFEFDEWERHTHLTSKLANLGANQEAWKNKHGHVSEFVTLRKYPRNATKAVARAIKVLNLEQQYGSCGISAVVSFIPSTLNQFSYDDLSAFIRLTKGRSEDEDRHDDGIRTELVQLAQSATEFTEQCQIIYDRKSSGRILHAQ